MAQAPPQQPALTAHPTLGYRRLPAADAPRTIFLPSKPVIAKQPFQDRIIFTTMPVESPTILLIDDEPSLLVLLQAALRRAGFDVYVANDGSEGEREALAHLPDIIVSDVMMSPPDGFELHQRLASNPATRNIPFIFLTARTDPAEKRRALESGAGDYITKPFDRDELIARIRAALRREPWQPQAEHPLGGSLNAP